MIFAAKFFTLLFTCVFTLTQVAAQSQWQVAGPYLDKSCNWYIYWSAPANTAKVLAVYNYSNKTISVAKTLDSAKSSADWSVTTDLTSTSYLVAPSLSGLTLANFQANGTSKLDPVVAVSRKKVCLYQKKGSKGPPPPKIKMAKRVHY
ncbi:hypothetical protein T439DRAFT_349790 [Meredithblackwellia eburnea MCA 4105]